jgi:hypothetical protein
MEKILDGLTHEEQLFAMYSLGRAIEGTPTPEKAAKIEHIAKLLSEITNTTITIEMDCKTRLDNTNPILQ